MAVQLGPIKRTGRLAVPYLGAQAVLAVAWWLGLGASASFRGWFELEPSRPAVLDAFLVADLVVLVGGSAMAAIGLARRRSWAPPATAAVSGGAAYATLYLAGWVLLGGHGWVGLVPMVAATTLTATVAVRLRIEP